jgi:hypothetical protein
MTGVRAVTLTNYKGFRSTRVSLEGTSVLVGANNAGKSTVVGALRLIAAGMPLARSRGPNHYIAQGSGRLTGWALSAAAVEAAAFSGENVRHDFREHEAQIELLLDNGVTLRVTWPAPDDDPDSGADAPAPLLSIDGYAGAAGSARLAAVQLVPAIGVVPSLTPVDDRETRIARERLRTNLTSRRASRSFRNALLAVAEDGDWDELEEHLLSVTPELRALSVRARPTDRAQELDVFYREPSGHERELTWAGDGLQIWLQAMFHLWRNRDANVIVLDEPDVFLHPELQRRLAQHLFALPAQKILATHSVEVLAEAPPGSAVWVDRTRRNSERPRRDGALAMLGRRLGSGLELGVARALRSRVALFVEGQDMQVLSRMAVAVGARRIGAGADVSVVPLGGFDRHDLASAFAEVLSVLGSDVRVRVILDRDLRDDETAAAVRQRIAARGAQAHIWQRKEIESYLLDSGVIARRTGLPEEEAARLLTEQIEALATDTRHALTGRRLEARGGRNERTVLREAEAEFDRLWGTVEGRLRLVAPKAVLSGLNPGLQQRRLPTLNARALAEQLSADSLPLEVHDLLNGIEDLLD